MKQVCSSKPAGQRRGGIRVRGMLAASVVALGLGVTGFAEARMYQWTSPQTGLAQLSGSPPSWYRSGAPGQPRVLAYENGTLVDDTSLQVSEERALMLREAAFDEVQRRKELVALKRLEETARREAEKAARKLRREKKREDRLVRAQTSETATENSESPLGSLEQFGSETIKRLKSIIAEFDRLGGEGAPDSKE